MRLPDPDSAEIPRAKIADYLLSPTHPSGRSKAAFFTQFGFSPDRWEELAAALRRHARDNDVDRSEATPFGIRYVVEGPLAAPDGKAPVVRSVWFVDAGLTRARFVTAYPLRK
jgi:hypothetical protein